MAEKFNTRLRHPTRAQVAAVEADIAAVEADIVAIQADLDSAEADIVQLQSDVSALQVDLAALQDDVTAIEAEIDVIESRPYVAGILHGLGATLADNTIEDLVGSGDDSIELPAGDYFVEYGARGIATFSSGTPTALQMVLSVTKSDNTAVESTSMALLGFFYASGDYRGFLQEGGGFTLSETTTLKVRGLINFSTGTNTLLQFTEGFAVFHRIP